MKFITVIKIHILQIGSGVLSPMALNALQITLMIDESLLLEIQSSPNTVDSLFTIVIAE